MFNGCAIRSTRVWLTAVLLALATCALFWQTRDFEFVDFDDNEYVFMNRNVLDGLNRKSVAWALTDIGTAANWHPLTWLSLQSDVSLAGIASVPPGTGLRGEERSDLMRHLSRVMHIHNVILHGINAGLLVILLVLLIGALDGSERGSSVGRQTQTFVVVSLAAALWAVHPLRCEVVCWVSERKECLSVFWALLTLTFYQAHFGANRSRLLYAMSVICFALALSAKPVVVGLPAIILALNFLNTPGGKGFFYRLGVVRTVPFVLLSVASCVLTLVAQKGAMMPLVMVPLGSRIINACASVGVYLRQSLLPYKLIALYPFTGVVNWFYVALGMAVCVAAILIGWRAGACLIRKTHAGGDLRVAVVTAAWCVFGLVPMSGILQVGSQRHADRYTYWIGIGFAFAVAWVLLRVTSHFRARASKVLFVLVAAGVVCVYAGLCQRQSRVWRDSRSLLTHAYEKDNGNPWAALGLADQLVSVDPVRAEKLYRESVASAAQEEESLGALALFLAITSDGKSFDEAFQLARRAVELSAKSVRGTEALGLIALRLGQFAQAEKHFLSAIRNGSSNPVVREWLKAAQTTNALEPGSASQR
jgi:protein O-mannosyl-transferase